MDAPASTEIGFDYLREALQNRRDGESFHCIDRPFERLRLALRRGEFSVMDRLARFRHALRYASIHSPSSTMTRTWPIDAILSTPTDIQLEMFGLRRRPGGWIEALAWAPEWLPNVGPHGADAEAMGEHDRPWGSLDVPIDPWLRGKFGIAAYRGHGQALAVRSALNVPAGRALLVLMATGEGKSLIFQALAAASESKVVIVVVPTVTLAQDHASSARALGIFGNHDMAYIGGRNEANQSIRDRIVARTQRLVFVAPEAAVTSLRTSILIAAQLGALDAIVVDEAHLVHGWGTTFRCEFQMLAALVEQARATAPPNHVPKVIALSATVTPTAYKALEALFSGKSPLGVAGAPRLRPELDIWIDGQWVDTVTRRQRVLEAICHLPRPAILYVTLPQHAEEWFSLLRELGFGSVACIHGGTGTASKEDTVNRWRSGELDIVVGTSAFGLGINYPHVRSIIHACLPEGVDRYYQEIGRAGRDGRSCIALLVPSDDDRDVAESQSQSTLISIAKGRSRWLSMFGKKETIATAALRYVVDLSTPPQYDLDMRSGRNEDWNAHVLNLMARAKLIQLVGLPSNEHGTKVEVEILDQGHTGEEEWNRCVEPLRQQIRTGDVTGFQRMLQLVNEHDCPRHLLRETYRLSTEISTVNVADACGGCEVCRPQLPGWFARWPHPPRPPWPIGGIVGPHFEFIDEGIAFAERPFDESGRYAQRMLIGLLEALWKAHWRKCIIVGTMGGALESALGAKPWCVARGPSALVLAANGLPNGPELVWVEDASMLQPYYVEHSVPECPRLYLIPHECEDSRYPGAVLSERKRVFGLQELLDRIET